MVTMNLFFQMNGSLKKMQSENWEQDPQKLMPGRGNGEK
jgi:hypothetical protein